MEKMFSYPLEDTMGGTASNEVKTYIYYFVGFQSPVCSLYYRLFIVYLLLGQCS